MGREALLTVVGRLVLAGVGSVVWQVAGAVRALHHAR